MNVMLHIINNHLFTRDCGEWFFDSEPEDLVESLSKKFKVTLKNLNKGVLVKVEKCMFDNEKIDGTGLSILANTKPLESDIFKNVMDNFENLLMKDIEIGTQLPDGSVVFAQSGGYWLACAPATMRTQKQWGLYEIETSLPNITSSSTVDPNTGYYNSSALGDYEDSAEANYWCRDQTGASYFLPSKEELLLMYLNKALIDSLDVSGGAYTLSYIATNGAGPNGTSSYCWSSTEYGPNVAWIVNMGNGHSYDYNKDDANSWVCPVTRIEVRS